MQIVIDIPENLYKATVNGLDANEIWDLRVAVANGTSLPKGHGRLIDGDYLYKKFVANKCHDSLVLQFIKDEPTIIEADNGESEV